LAVAVSSTNFPNAMDALLSNVRMPPGVPVATMGVDSSGMKNAALFACQIAARTDAEIAINLSKYFENNNKPAEIEYEKG
jgi:5-(carboxyamino)imidazole ribonucleotide mutase